MLCLTTPAIASDQAAPVFIVTYQRSGEGLLAMQLAGISDIAHRMTHDLLLRQLHAGTNGRPPAQQVPDPWYSV
jgi:hypothetical protein